VVEVASEKQASDIVLLDLREVCSFADYFVICTGESERQIRSICDDMDQALEERGVLVNHQEGTAESGWVLIDFGDVIVHVFNPAQREYYHLEGIWSDATPVVHIQ
jgi:ribosome-associated protein